MVRRVSDALLDDEPVAAAADTGPEVVEDDDELELSADPEDEDADPEEEDDDLDPAAEPEAEPEPIAARQQTRGQRQHAQLRQRAREAETRLEEAERRAREAEARAAANTRQQSPMESPEVRNARLAAMDPSERTEFLINELRADTARDRQMVQFQAADQADRSAYDTIAVNNPHYRKYKEEVEHRLTLLRNNGQNVPRETILKFIVGEKVVASRAPGKTKAQRDQAAERVRSQVATPTRSRGDSGKGARESESTARARRLENLQI